MLPLIPPVQAAVPPTVTVAPQTPLLGDAERTLLTALDAGERPLRPAKIPAPDRLAFDWLWHAAAWKPGGPLPASPFPKGSGEDREAQAWRAFLSAGTGSPIALPLSQSGSRLLLWEWMRHRDRHTPLMQATRHRLEDRLLAGGAPMIQGWALRHALCFAIAEKDGARFAALKAAHGSKTPDTFSGIQALFGLIGGPSPVFRLWQLPGLRYQDATLGDLGAREVWICPPGIPVPQGAAWIIPSQSGVMNDREANLSPSMKEEAEALTPALHGHAAWFAPSKTEWEATGLSWFPILVTLDEHGNIGSVQMGDAAP